jgi:hypothetical protein
MGPQAKEMKGILFIIARKNNQLLVHKSPSNEWAFLVGSQIQGNYYWLLKPKCKIPAQQHYYQWFQGY